MEWEEVGKNELGVYEIGLEETVKDEVRWGNKLQVDKKWRNVKIVDRMIRDWWKGRG